MAGTQQGEELHDQLLGISPVGVLFRFAQPFVQVGGVDQLLELGQEGGCCAQFLPYGTQCHVANFLIEQEQQEIPIFSKPSIKLEKKVPNVLVAHTTGRIYALVTHE